MPRKRIRVKVIKSGTGRRKFILLFVLALAAGLYAALGMSSGMQSSSISDSSSQILAHAPRGAQDDHPHSGQKNIQFPISALGDCATQSECKSFCDDPANMLACVNFAEKNGLMSKSEAGKARKMAELGVRKGPGGCNSEQSCETYCGNIKNIRECVSFAKQHGMLAKSELAEAEKVIAALDKGAKLPGGCTSKTACDTYCAQPKNIQQCVDFAEAAGFMNAKEAAMVRKTGGVGPGGCFGKDACEVFCNQADHMSECIDFAIQHDLMPPGEREEALKVAAYLKRGGKLPGGCTNKKSCEAYCMKSENMSSCLDFAEGAGFMSKEDIAMARKMMAKGITSGPGGCRSAETCMSYCSNPKNMLECMAFAARHGITPDDLK